ncbi:MAG: mechanosensitive ion channel family protein [Chloroflexi bacterium]|nr:mechanosensitive ion channel family protein [Chloroflexota bacterium]
MEHLFLVPSSWAEWRQWSRDGAPQLAGIIAGVIAVNIVFRTVISRALRRAIGRAIGLRMDDTAAVERRADTLISTLTWLFTIFVLFVGVSLALDNLGLNVSALVASVGIVGLALGLGAQTLIKDIINGTLILIEDQYRAGDVVTVAGVSGTVLEVNPRRTVLRDANGNVHTVPNSAITVATNQTQGMSRLYLDLTVPYEVDLARALAVIGEVCEQVGQECAGDILSTPHVLRVDGFVDNGVVVKVAGDVRAGAQWRVMGLLRERVKLRFDEAGLDFGPRPRAAAAVPAQPAPGSAPGADGAVKSSP